MLSAIVSLRRREGDLHDDRLTMSVGEAAERLGISKPTLLRLWTQGLLEGYRVTPYRNGRVRLYRDSVEMFDRQRKNQVGTSSSST
jgi:excisionase family DNA binding protein